MSNRREFKYRFIRYLNAGYSLADAKRKATVVKVAADPEYMSAQDRKDLTSLASGIHRLTMTRGRAVDIMKERLFKPRRVGAGTRAETIASFTTAFGVMPPINFPRESAIQRKGKKNKPQPGSSKGKIGKSRVINARRTLVSFRNLIRTFKKMDKSGRKSSMRDLTKAAAGVTASIKRGGQ